MSQKSAIEKLKNKKIYSVEGNIGAGKTTILKIIGQKLDDVEFVEEPVSIWQNLGGDNLLEKFYENPERWGFSFEFYCMLSKINALCKVADTPKPFIVLERSLFSNKIFMDISKNLGTLNDMEYTMLMNTYDLYIQHVYPHLSGIIYLNTPVNLCINRIINRNRGEESGVDVEYLTLLEKSFNKFINECTIPTLQINGNFDIVRDSTTIGKNIHNFMSNRTENKVGSPAHI